MRNCSMLYLLFHTLASCCVERNLSRIEDDCSLTEITSSSLRKDSPGTTTPKPLTEFGKNESEYRTDFDRDSKLHIPGEIEITLASTSLELRHRNSEFGPPKVSSDPKITENEQKQTSPQTSLNTSLRPDAAPFMPQSQSRSSQCHPSKHVVTSFSSGPSTAIGPTLENQGRLYLRVFLEFIHQTSLVRAHESWKVNIVVRNLRLPAKVVAGFPRAEELQTWLRLVALTRERKGNHPPLQPSRKRLVIELAQFENAYRPLQTPSAVEEDPGILEAYDFGQLCLRAFSTKLSMGTFKHLSVVLKERIASMNVSEDDHFDKFFFWPIILAGAKESFLREASVFSKYLKCLTYEKPEESGIQASKSDIETGKDPNKENSTKYIQEEIKLLSKILSGERIKAECHGWMDYYEKITIEEDYHSLNTMIERIIYRYFHIEAETFNGKKLFISQEKQEQFHLRWGLQKGSLMSLVKRCMISHKNRGKLTMSYDLSKESFNYYKDKILELVERCSKDQARKNGSCQEISIGQFLKEIYG